MKVYTYYDDINFNYQDELLMFWEKSWKNNGFETNILSRSNVEKHPFYKEYVKRLKDLHLKLTGITMSNYGLSCWLRWLAYATEPEEKFYVCDYDVINHSFQPTTPNHRLHLMDGECPCVASGSPYQFLELCKKIVEFTEENLLQFKIELHELFNFFNKKRTIHFHDQQFFGIYKLLDKEGILMSIERNKFLGIPDEEKFWERQLVHYAFGVCKSYCVKNNIKYNSHDAKCIVIKKYLKL